MGAREVTAAAARRTHPDVEAYLARVPLPGRALAGELRALVRAEVADARENLYYGVPFFFVDDSDLCYVSAAKTHVTFGFTMGALLRDPRGRLEGTGKSPIRKVALRFDDPVPADARGWVRQAAQLARAGNGAPSATPRSGPATPRTEYAPGERSRSRSR